VTAEALAPQSVDAPAARPVIDRGAIFAGWVGVGMALVIAIAFELIIAVQSIVFLVAPIAGILVGAYANQRSERWRPRRRVIANSLYAALVTGLSLAVMYALLRLLFIFADSGYPDFNRADSGGAPIGIQCATGPDCTYQRYVAAGRDPELRGAGVTDGASFGSFVVREQLQGGGILVLLTLAGSLVPAAWRSLHQPPSPARRVSATATEVATTS
jgi:hypothetical protein